MSDIRPYRPSPYPLPPRDDVDLPFQEEETANLRDYWIVIRKYRWTIVAFLLPAVLMAGISLWWAPSSNTATTTLHIENLSPNITGMAEAFPLRGTSLDQYYQTQLNLLKSRSLAARVIQDLGLSQDPRFEASPEGLSAWLQKSVRQGIKSVVAWVQELGPVQWLLERLTSGGEEEAIPTPTFELGVVPDLIDSYLERLIIALVEESQLIKVSFSSVDPALSRDVVNAHVSSFIRTSLLTRFELTAEARQFLEEKLTELKGKLEKSESDLNRFRKTHAIVAIDKAGDLTLDRLRGLNNDLTQARSRRIELESLYRIVQQRDHQLLSQVIDNPMIRQMKDQISSLEVERAQLATIFKPTYAAVVALQQQINQAKGRVDQEVGRIVRSIASDYRAAVAREEALTTEMEQARRSTLDLREKALEAAVLEREVESNRTLYDNVFKRSKETDLTGAVPVSNIRVVDRADIPIKPDDAKGKRNLGLSVLIGLLGGVGLAFIRHYLDNTLRTPEDVRRYLHLPTLGLVPDITRLDKREHGLGQGKRFSLARGPVTRHHGQEITLAISHNPYSVVSESYQSICTALLFSQAERPPRSILITSAQPKEGKTATAISIARIMAWNGAPVLLIDADLRNGRCHRLLGLQNGKGLTDVLTGNGLATDLIQRTSISNLSLLSRGSAAPNPAQLLASEKIGQMLTSLLVTDFSYIIIDSAPLLPISDSVVLATKVDGVVLVTRGQNVSRYVARQACDRLASVRAQVLGVVLNGVDIHSPEYKDYKSSYVTYYTGYPSDDV
jgi:succinoglycan biosynthesis transport protein ExoP